jgi:hypothetical protein
MPRVGKLQAPRQVEIKKVKVIPKRSSWDFITVLRLSKEPIISAEIIIRTPPADYIPPKVRL